MAHRSKHKAGKVKVTYGDGRTEILKQGDFDKRRRKRGGRWYIRTDHWKEVRKQAKIRDGYSCARCSATKRLEVHHLHYNRIGQEHLEDVVTLCQPCHARADRERRYKTATRRKAKVNASTYSFTA